MDEKYLVHLADPWQMPAESVYQFQIQLESYIDNIPNFSAIRLLARTSLGTYTSPCIHIFTL